MTRLSVDYVGLVRDLTVPFVAADMGSTLFGAVAERYEYQFPDCSLPTVRPAILGTHELT